MRKRLFTICLMLFCTVIGLWGCSASPYENMSMTITGIEANETLQLNIYESEVSGQIVRQYDSVSFEVVVADDNEMTDLGVVVTGGGYVVSVEVGEAEAGVTEVTITARAQGSSTIYILSKEGNITKTIDVNVDLVVNEITFKSGKNTVIKQGSTLDLSDTSSYLNFSPKDTSQRDVKYEIMIPEDGEKMPNGKTYMYSGNNGLMYAAIINDVLVTYENVVFPMDTATGKYVVTVKVTSLANDKICDFIDFEVVSINDDIHVYINSDVVQGELIELIQNKDGCYEVVLANPSYDLGITEVNNYLYSRNIYFMMDYGGDNDTNYIVRTDLIPDSKNSAITLSDISATMENLYMGVFCAQSVKEGGSIVHTFRVEHKSFEGMFTQEVKVMFIVKNFTRDITIESSTKGEDGIIYIYDTYSTGVLGSSINVTLKPYYEGQKYYICFPASYTDSLSLVRSSGKAINMATYDPITSIFDLEDATECSVGATVYLKHKYIIVPAVDTVTMYILTYFDLASFDYVDSKEGYFNVYPIMQSIDVKIVKGMTDISIENSNYSLDVTNEQYVDPGIRLLELPQGNSFENTIESIEYSNHLDICYIDLLYENNICSLMLKINDQFIEGSVDITITTINGLSKTINVKTFIPVAYPTIQSKDFDSRWQGDETSMPLNVEIDTEDDAYLGDMSLLYTVDNVTGDMIYDTATSSSTIIVDVQKLVFDGFVYSVEDWAYSYTTFTDLVLSTNSSIEMNIFNYLLYEDDLGRKIYRKINVNDSVTASYSILNYIKWEDGVLTTYSNKTTNKNIPVRLSLNYNGYVEYNDMNGNYYTEKVKVNHVINVWVYDVINTVDLVSSKNVTLYDSSSLGYYDESSCKYDIEVEVNPEVEDLGGWVTEANALYGVNMLYNVNDKHITTIYNDNRTNKVDVMLSDLYSIENDVITARVGQRVEEFVRYDPNVTQTLEEILAMIYRNKVSFSVNIYVTQFNKTTAINSILVTLDFANMVESIYLDTDKDGLYFEVRSNAAGELTAYPSQASVSYLVNPDIAYNSNVRLINYITASYYVLEGNVITDNTFTIIPKLSAGEYTLIVAAEDSFYTQGADTYYYRTFQTLKIKIADGSREYPFEIRTVQDFEKMLDDIDDGLNYHYVLVNDINLAGYQFKNYTFANTDDEFILDGEYRYVSNGITMYRYSTIYGLNVNIDAAATEREVDDDLDYVNLGLFTTLPQVATIKNVTFKNVSLTVTLSATYKQKTYNVGVLAGLGFGSIINSQVSGNVQLSLNTCSKVNLGGMVGYLGNPAMFYADDSPSVDAVITGYPCQMDESISESTYNSNVAFKVLGSNTPTSNINIGGISGVADFAGLHTGNIKDVNVAMSINTGIYATIGGVIGRAYNTYISCVKVVPIIWNDTDVDGVTDFTNMNLGGIIGLSNRSSIEDSIVYFNDLGSAFVGLSAVSIYGNGNLGGMIGNSTNDVYSYSYVRSFYDDIISVSGPTISYYGNIVIISKGAAGGLAGTADAPTIRNAYFDADICGLTRGVNIGGFAGEANQVTIVNSYILSQLVIIENDTLYNSLDDVSVIFGNEVDELAPNSQKEYNIDVGASSTINNVYAIINNAYFTVVSSLNSGKFTLFNEVGRTLEYVYKIHVLKETSSETKYSSFEIFGGRVFKFAITDGVSFYKNATLSNTLDVSVGWFVSNKLDVHINAMVVGQDVTSLPVITRFIGGKFVLLYDILPSNMSANIPECTTFSSKAYLNISKEEIDPDTSETTYTTQVVLFYNETSGGISAHNEYYISVSSVSQFVEGSVINISLNSNVLSTTYVKIELNNRVTLTESSNGTIIRLVNNTIYTMGEGLAVLRIASTQDSSVYTDINVLVVKGISDFILYNYESEDKTPVQNTDSIYSVDSLETIYVDDYKYYKFDSENKVVDNNGEKLYTPNTSVGYMLEVLETNEGVKISIDGTNIAYSTTSSNIYLFDDIDAMIMSGVGFSEDDSFIYFKITPFIIFNDVEDGFYNERIYTAPNSFVTSRPAKESAYLVRDGGFWSLKNCVLVSDLAHSYAFRVLAKAYSVSFGGNLNEVNISPLATFKTSLNLITSNVNISNTFACEKCDRIINVDVSNTCSNCGNVYEDINVHNSRLLENLSMYLVGKNTFELYDDDLSVLEDFKINISLRDRYLDSFIGTIISSSLMEFTFENITISRVALEDHNGTYITNSYMVSFSIVVNFNQDLYKNDADSYDLNNLSYVLIFAPEDPTIIDPAIMKIGIEPLELNTITPKFYPNAEGLSSVNEIEIPEELESEYIVRNRKGLLKVSLDPEFNNSSYVTVTADISLKDVLNVGQMSALINNTGVSSYVSGYEDVIYKDTVLDEINRRFGVRLSKLSTNYRNDILFDNVYYISLVLNAASDMVGEDIVIYITSYKLVNGVGVATKEIPVTLKVYDLPEISITLDNGEKQGFVAVGSSVPVNVSVANYTGSTIPFSFSVNSNANDGKFYFVNDENELVRNEFDVEYLNNGGRYYLCADASASYSSVNNLGVETFKVILKVQEHILGSVETVTTSLSMQVVEMIINNISVNGTIDADNRNEMQILHGESVVLSVSLEVNDVMYGDAADLEDLRLKNYLYYPNVTTDSKGNKVVFGTKEILEYLFAGTSVQLTKQNDTTGWIDYVTGNRNDSSFKIWFLEDYYGGEKVYVALNVGSYDNFNVLSSSYRYSTVDYIADYLLYALKGTTISDDTVIKCSITYYYDNDGIIQLGYSSTFATYELTFEFNLVVEDNSTYDHPNPIESEYDLANMEEGANYILINNIEVEDWTPYAASFATLDGNGYTIKVKSFNFDDIRGSENEKDAGLFTTIAEGSVVKNLVLDVSELLISESDMLTNLEQSKQNVDKFDATTYRTNYAIDLSFMSEVHFGMLAGTNKGSVTNVKLISTKNTDEHENYLHIVTSQAYINGKITHSSIGGLIGVNEGAISNSYVGLNYSTLEASEKSYIEMVVSPSALTYSNVEDELGEVETYPFIIAGGNVLAGVVSENKGILSNSYVKGIGLYNTFPIVEYSRTGGVIANNLSSGYVTSCFIEGYSIANYRASTTDDYFIESTGNIGGFVYSNDGTIENAYSNISLQTQSAYSGGFVYTNNATGVINYAYSTAVSRQSKAHGQFTGVYVKNVQNEGLYTSCFYLVAIENETPNVSEPATAIETYSVYNPDNSVGYAFSDVDTWNGFAFVSGNNNDSIWTMPDINSTSTSSDLRGPQINATLTDTISFRRLSNREDIYQTDENGNIILDENGDWVIASTEYEYEYNTYSLGSRENPLIIDTAKNFVKYIIDNTDVYSYDTYDYIRNNSGDYVKINDQYILDADRLYPLHDRYIRVEAVDSLHVFGAGSLANVGNNSIISNINDVQYVRLINNLNFETDALANAYKGVHLYDIVFAGSLDGNGMTMSSLNLTVGTMSDKLDNFGLFAQIGLSESDITNITGISGITSELQSAVKNVKITVRTYKSNGAKKAGVLAGTINNSSIVNIEISAENDIVIISAVNMAGVLAGLIYSDNNYVKNEDYAAATNYSIVRLIDIKIKNIQVEATYNSLGAIINAATTIVDSSYYTKFNIKGNSAEVNGFNSLYNRETGTTDLSRTNVVSYAGMVAGVISVNNYVRQVGYHGEDDHINEYDRFTYYRTTPSETVIRNIVVSDGFQIQIADNAGGLFGYVGENTHIKESQLVVGGGAKQYIKGRNFAGGIVGENHGILEQVYVAHEDKAQQDIDAVIFDPGRTVSDDNLFGVQSEESYTVVIGGIAGYSANGVIVDAYSKVNVIKPNSYVAGGLVGYAEDYNYIAFAYATGTVYSSRVVGGLIGFYKYTMVESGNEDDGYTYAINDKHFLYMKSVVSLAHWNYSEGDVDVRAAIGTSLYDNYKSLYRTGASGYYDFDVTMPEIGNQKIKSYLNVSYYADTGLYNLVDTTSANLYYAGHTNKYVGSAIGRALYHTIDATGEAVPSDREQISFIQKEKMFVDIDNYIENNIYTPGNDPDYDIKNLTARYFVGVYTDTYGAYTPSGSTENGNKNDSYNNGGFSIVSGIESKSLGSFKTVGSGYRYATADAFNNLQLSQVKGDVLFDKIFTAQEYLQQIIGYYGSMEDGGTGENLYKNLFSNVHYAKDRYEYNLSNVETVDWINGTYTNGAQENDYTSNIWAVNSYIPTKSFGIYGNIKYVSNSQELIDVFNDANNNMTYYIQPQEGNAPYIINVNSSGENYNLYRFTNTFTGALRSLDSDEKIKIIINYGSDGDHAVSLFRELNSASFYNISFVLNINNSIDITADKYGYMGMFANRVISTQFQNCEFTINVNTTNTLLTVETVGMRTADYFGGLFGYVSGVNIYSASVLVNAKLSDSIQVNDESLNLKSFSFVMGFVTNCVMSNISFSAIHFDNADNEGLRLEYHNVTDMSEVVVGGIMAFCKNSTIEFTPDNYVTGVDISFTSDAYVDVINVGGIFANATYTKIKNPIYNGDIDIVRASNEADVSVGGIIGYALYDTLYNAKVAMEDADSIKINGNHTIKLSNTVGAMPKSSVVAKIAMGGIVGYNAAGTVIGEIGAVEENTVNNANLEIIIGDNAAHDVNNVDSISVGGLVGYSATSSSLLNRAINTGDITIEDYSNMYIKTGSAISVGGLVGYAAGIIGVNYVYNAGNITTKFAKVVEKLYVGGIVGGANHNINITNFANYGDINGGYTTTVDGDTAVVGGYAACVGGIVGYNNITSALKYGYSFGEIFNYNDSVTVSVIAGGNIDSESLNVYYVQEFMKNNYDTDSVFIPVVYADLYDTEMLGLTGIDKYRYTEIEELKKYGFSAIKEGRIFVYTINGLISPFTNGFKKIESRVSDLSNADGSKYNPLLVSTTNNTDIFGAYNVVLLNMEWDNTKDVVIDKDVIISGKTQVDRDGNLLTTVMSLVDNKHPFVKENHGVISNLTIYRSDPNDADYAYEGDFAYGVIENYGTLFKVNTVIVSHTSGTESTSALVSYNEGNIIASGAIELQKYLYSSVGDGIYTSYSALVWINAGYIADCYSTSYLYGDIKDGIQDLNYDQYVYGLVYSNGYVNESSETLTGVIKYSYHYMKGVYEEDSDTKLFITARGENYSLIGQSIGKNSLELYVRDKVEITVLPTWIGARVVWNSNLDTDNNYGYPYIKNTYITGTVVVSSVDISTIISNNLYSNDEFTSDDLSIQYSFFKNMNDENSIIVSTPAKLYSILSSAANSTLSNQIILLTKDLDMTGYELKSVISYNYATIVGAVLVGETYRNAVISNLTVKGGSMFGTNYGIVAFIDFDNLTVTGDTYVASICVHNKGTISHVNIRNSYIYGNSYVGGIASYNSVPSNISSNVGIYYVSLNNVSLYNGSSSGYTGGIAAVNEGSTTRNYTHGILDSSVVGLQIYSLGSYCGGIVGRNYGKITDVVVRGIGSSNRLTITVSGGSYVGGIAGYTTVEITGNNNSVSYVNISGSNYIGGYYGYSLCNLSNARISDVILTSTVSNSLGESYVGGFVGYTSANISVSGTSAIRLSNIEISARGYYVGGLVGYMEKRFGHIRINSSTGIINMNNVNIKSGSAYVGGILGKAKEDNVIISGYDDYNPITVTGGLYIKTQDVNSTTAYIGGIISSCASVADHSASFKSELSYISIAAPLTIESRQVTDYVGGITGYAKDIVMKDVVIASGYNVVIEVPKAKNVGGIVGCYDGNLDYDTEKCIFDIGSVKINAVSHIGAYIGYVKGGLQVLKPIDIAGASNSYIEIVGNSSAGNIGGVFGYIDLDVYVDSSIAMSYVNVNKSNENYVGVYYGGVFGNIGGKLDMTPNSSIEINYLNLYGNNYVGAITGKVTLLKENTNIYNVKIREAKVYGSSNYVGGVFGYVNNDISLCGNIDEYKLKVEGNYYVGGVFGYVNGDVTINGNITASSGEITGYSNVSPVVGVVVNTSNLVVASTSTIEINETLAISEVSVGGLVYSAGFVYIAGSYSLVRSRLETRTSNSDYGTAGGVVGLMFKPLIITGSVNIAGDDTYSNVIRGYKYAGGLVGRSDFGQTAYNDTIAVITPSVDEIDEALYVNNSIYVHGGDVDISYTSIVAEYYAGGIVAQVNGNLVFAAGSDLRIEHSNITVSESASSGISAYAGGLIAVKYNTKVFVYSSTVNILLTTGDIVGPFIGYVIGFDCRSSIYHVSLTIESSTFVVGPDISSEYYYGEVSNNR